MPPLLTSLFLVFVAARTGWFPIGGMTSSSAQQGLQGLTLKTNVSFSRQCWPH
jgi:hypothetical protein